MNVLHWFQSIAYLTASLGQTRISTNHTGPTHIIYTIKSYIDIALKATIKTSKFAFYICDSWHLIVIVLIFVFKNLIRYLTESELIHLQRIKCNFFFYVCELWKLFRNDISFTINIDIFCVLKCNIGGKDYREALSLRNVSFLIITILMNLLINELCF